MEALARLQDDVEPFPFAEAEEIVAEELGVRWEGVREFEPAPIAAASLGQVHRAVLRGGRASRSRSSVPASASRSWRTSRSLRELAAFLDRTPMASATSSAKTVATFGDSLLAELDYRREAQNLVTARRRISRTSTASSCPARRRLHHRARADDGVRRRPQDHRPRSVTRLDLDGGVLADQLFKAYLAPGRDRRLLPRRPASRQRAAHRGRRLAMLDLGMTGRVPSSMRDTLLGS